MNPLRLPIRLALVASALSLAEVGWSVVISNIAVPTVSHSGAMVTWDSDVPGTTEIEFGPTAAYGHTFTVANSVLNHFQPIGGMPANTLCHFRVKTRDASNVLAVSSDQTFMTLTAGPNAPAAPQKVDTSMPTQSGQVISVSAAACGATPLATCFKNALSAASLGDTILLEAGATFTGNFTLPVKSSGSGWIIIRTSTPDNQLPAPGTRMTPAYASLLPKIVTANAVGAIQVALGSHHYRLIGLDISGMGQQGVLVNFDAGANQTSVGVVPHHLVIDRCLIHGPDAATDTRVGVNLNAASGAVIDSTISDIHSKGDAHGVGMWNSPGPVKIDNNYIESSGEAIHLGGAQPKNASLLPSDIEITRNYIYKPRSWDPKDPSFAGIQWVQYNTIQIRKARRVLIYGNIVENTWVQLNNLWTDVWSGLAVVISPESLNSATPFDAVQDVAFVNNIVTHSPGGVGVTGWNLLAQSEQTQRIQISNNLMTDIYLPPASLPSQSVFQVRNGVEDIQIDHNTILASSNVITFDGVPSAGLVMTNTIVPHSANGIVGNNGGGIGTAALNAYLPAGYTFLKNVVPGTPANELPVNNFYPASLSGVGFVNYPTDLHLSASSLYKSQATDGKDVGADVDAVLAATQGVKAGNPGGAPPPPAPPPPSGPPPVTLPPATGVVPSLAPRVFPNPCRLDRGMTQVTFDPLNGDSTIKIFTVSAHHVRTLTTSSATATWDLKNESGERVASGVYRYLITNNLGQKVDGQIAIIK